MRSTVTKGDETIAGCAEDNREREREGRRMKKKNEGEKEEGSTVRGWEVTKERAKRQEVD